MVVVESTTVRPEKAAEGRNCVLSSMPLINFSHYPIATGVGQLENIIRNARNRMPTAIEGPG